MREVVTIFHRVLLQLQQSAGKAKLNKTLLLIKK